MGSHHRKPKNGHPDSGSSSTNYAYLPFTFSQHLFVGRRVLNTSRCKGKEVGSGPPAGGHDMSQLARKGMVVQYSHVQAVMCSQSSGKGNPPSPETQLPCGTVSPDLESIGSRDGRKTGPFHHHCQGPALQFVFHVL